jgi:hypothetical protein
MRSTIFRTKYVIEIGIAPFVAYCRIAAKPVTPPPIIPFGVRNIAQPKAYIVRPTVIRKYSFINVPKEGF